MELRIAGSSFRRTWTMRRLLRSMRPDSIHVSSVAQSRGSFTPQYFPGLRQFISAPFRVQGSAFAAISGGSPGYPSVSPADSRSASLAWLMSIRSKKPPGLLLLAGTKYRFGPKSTPNAESTCAVTDVPERYGPRTMTPLAGLCLAGTQQTSLKG